MVIGGGGYVFPRYLEKASDPKFDKLDAIISRQKLTSEAALSILNGDL